MHFDELPRNEIFTLPEDLKHGNEKPIQGYLDENDCFICKSHGTKDGFYHRIKRNKKEWLLHRWMYNFFVEEIPEGEIIRHLCHNTHCSNPSHLVRGTKQDNSNDMVKANRQARGSRCANSKLNESIVAYIRFIAKSSTKELAEMFNVSVSAVGRILSGKTWRHVTEEYLISKAA